MNTVAVTISTNETPQIRKLVDRMRVRFEKLNRIELVVLREKDIDYSQSMVVDQRYLKAYLWDYLPSGTDRVIYIDRDMVPMRPLGLGSMPNAIFAAAQDHRKGREEAQEIWPIFKRTGLYFNSGFMVAHRSTEPQFEQVASMQSVMPDHHGCYDQTLFNLAMQHQWDVAVLPKEYNYCVAIDDQVVERPRMVHCCGTIEPYTLMAYLLEIPPCLD